MLSWDGEEETEKDLYAKNNLLYKSLEVLQAYLKQLQSHGAWYRAPEGCLWSKPCLQSTKIWK